MSALEQQTPEGYKQTEVGVLPDDWDCVILGDLGDIVRGGSPRPAGDPKYFNGNYIPWLTVASLTNIPASKQEVTSTLTKLTELGSKQSRILDAGTLIISNSGATLGVAKVLGLKCCANDGVAAIINQKKGNKSFITHYINTQTKRLHDDVATGNGQPNLNTDLIKLIPIPFPSESEQTAIANALSDVDALLTELDKLIAKKQAIKTASMQQLLTGKTRLPQFATYNEGEKKGQPKGTKPSELGEIPEDWDVQPLSKLSTYINDGTHHTPTYTRDGIPFYSVENVSANDFYNVKYISEEEHKKLIKRCKPEKGDILMTRIGTLGVTRVIDWEVDASIYVSLALIKLRQEVRPEYVYSFSKSSIFKQEVEKRSLVNATPQKINMIEIGQVPILFPKNEKEQTAIATILSDMDNEIQTLEQRLAKTRQIKQGMMQELLTGRTRLPYDNAESA